MPETPFYGWRIVAACMAFVSVSWSLGIFGMGVYVYALTESRGFSIGTVSTAVTTAYVVSAVLMVGVGRFIARRGPRPVVAVGVLAMTVGVTAMPHCQQPWQVHAAFLTLGLGMACLSTNTVGSTLAPWFERHQGRAMSTAMLGASIGGMTGTPLLMAGIRAWGFQATMALAAVIAVVVVLPLAAFVLKTRPQDMGQLPDGMPATEQGQSAQAIRWNLKEAIATRQFRSHVMAFGLGLMVQVGFLSHHVPIAIPVLGPRGAAAAVFSAAVAAFLGRLLLARYADQVDIRKVGACVFLLAAASLVCMALLPGPWALMATSVSFGLTVGNVTTLAPMILRREFGAASFGVVFGLAATLNQLSMALGPTVYGLLRAAFGSYGPALLLCGLLNLGAGMAIVWGGRRPLTAPHGVARVRSAN
ncbi:MFS transporter [Pseudorhodoferax sp.]|uniref:MFS transporter n=1 Tax=Pseudorhodoferax sp. TaxID=1993553 RepID=UPI0039E4AAAE